MNRSSPFHYCCLNLSNLVLPSCNGTWTKYFDRDDPSHYYDRETISELRKNVDNVICENPILVDARVVGTHIHYSQTGQIFTINTDVGFECENALQLRPMERCKDYEVRFCCS